MNTNVLKYLFYVLIFFPFAFVSGQIVITSGSSVSAEEMVGKIVGEGIQYFNVQYFGADTARGIFSNGFSTNLGMNNGIFLTSGAGNIIPGPNSLCSAGVDNGIPGYPALTAICTGTNTYDASVLEFDFIPESDTIRFKYLFGSEEYNDWVGSMYNDVFGFFISGPNPLGGLYGDKNIALVPGTNIGAKINSINNGFASCGNIPIGPCTNCVYYKDNTGGTTLQYDGFTVVMTAFLVVIPGAEYHIKLGVADAGDGVLDSGIFIEEHSFISPVATGLSDIKQEIMTVFPNPSDGKFFLQGNFVANEPAEIKVTDLSGRIVYLNIIDLTDKAVIDLEAEPKGMYFMQIKSGTLNLNRKLIIQ